MNTFAEPNYVSLFSGCGGFDIGFDKAGFRCLGAFDNNPVALKNLASNLDIPTFDADLRSGSLPVNVSVDPEVVLSGSPCQGFSTAGKRNVDDPRNSLLIIGAKLAIKLNPKVFIAENVPGVLSGKQSKYWNELVTILEEAGYFVSYKKVYADRLGVPQKRTRVLLVASKKGKFDFNLPFVNGGSLKSALEGLEGLSNHYKKYIPKGTRDYQIARSIKQGQKLSNVRGGERSVHSWNIPEIFGKVTLQENALLEDLIHLRRRMRIRDFGDADPVDMQLLIERHSNKAVVSLLRKNYLRELEGGKIDLVGSFNGKYRRLRLDGPSCTVDTRFGNHQYFLHPKSDRGFSVREAARIQTFPDNYEFSGSIQSQYTMVGNAVPPRVSYLLAIAIKNHLEGVA